MGLSGNFASLSPCLLARKGGAKPAMRSQLQALQQPCDAVARLPDDWSNDLGWNDMGDPVEVGADIIAIGTAKPHSPAVVPEVVRQRGKIAAKLSTTSRRSDKAERRSALDEGRRCAFTLRIDAERHLRLRLAGAVHHRSAQAIVTDALDHYLAGMPGIEALAEQARTKPRKS
ncbi:MAG TPA: hypothetical protein VJM34_17925 [Novosphingobium sp.]|nr:hypothetical protein [Novosphingobium sp.]